MSAGSDNRPSVEGDEGAIHLAAIAWSLLLLLILVAAGWWRTGRAIDARAASSGVAQWPQRLRGLALNRAQIRLKTTIPAFGSSELSNDVLFRPDRLFARSPSGFVLYPIGGPGQLLMHHVLAAGALGDELRGRRVIVFVLPNEFAMTRPKQRQQFFAGNFSRVHAATLLANNRLPTELRREILRRLTDYPVALKRDPTIDAAARLAKNQGPMRWQLTAAVLAPTIWLEATWLGAIDRFRAATATAHPPMSPNDIIRVHAPIPWDSLAAVASSRYLPLTRSNAFGFPDTFWANLHGAEGATLRHRGENFARLSARSDAWIELDLLLRTLGAVGARPVLVSLPMAAMYLEATGAQPSDLAAFYSHLHRVASAAGASALSFEALDTEPGQLIDLETHLSPVGWVAVDKAIDSLVHADLH